MLQKWLRRGNMKKEAKTRFIATQNNAIRTSCVKAKIILNRRIASERLFGDR